MEQMRAEIHRYFTVKSKNTLEWLGSNSNFIVATHTTTCSIRIRKNINLTELDL